MAGWWRWTQRKTLRSASRNWRTYTTHAPWCWGALRLRPNVCTSCLWTTSTMWRWRSKVFWKPILNSSEYRTSSKCASMLNLEIVLKNLSTLVVWPMVALYRLMSWKAFQVIMAVRNCGTSSILPLCSASPMQECSFRQWPDVLVFFCWWEDETPTTKWKV